MAQVSGASRVQFHPSVSPFRQRDLKWFNRKRKSTGPWFEFKIFTTEGKFWSFLWTLSLPMSCITKGLESGKNLTCSSSENIRRIRQFHKDPRMPCLKGLWNWTSYFAYNIGLMSWLILRGWISYSHACREISEIIKMILKMIKGIKNVSNLLNTPYLFLCALCVRNGICYLSFIWSKIWLLD